MAVVRRRLVLASATDEATDGASSTGASQRVVSEPGRGPVGKGAHPSLVGTIAGLLASLLVAVLLATTVFDVLSGDEPQTNAAGTDAEPACTRQVGPTPDLAELLDRLRPGDVACLAAGTYGTRGTRVDWTASGEAGSPVTVRAASRGAVRVHGFLNVEADHVVLDGLLFEGPSGAVNPANTPDGEEVLVWAHGDHVTVRRCEVKDGLWRAGIYVTGRAVSIDACWIHDIGPWSDPSQEQAGGRADNTDHGVYWGQRSSGTLTNSVLEHNVAYGLQISDGAGAVLVANNTIVRNGTGGVIWAERTSGSTLVNNILAFNDGYAVNAHLLQGVRNVARDNLAFGNAFGEWNDDGPLVTRRNLVANPAFMGRRDYRLQATSPAIDVGSASGAPRHDLDGRLRSAGAGPDMGAYESSPDQ